MNSQRILVMNYSGYDGARVKYEYRNTYCKNTALLKYVREENTTIKYYYVLHMCY